MVSHAQLLMRLALELINTTADHFDPSAIGISAPVDMPEKDSNSKLFKASTITSSSNAKALIQPPFKGISTARKRTFVEREADDSYLDMDPRLSKKPRTQEHRSRLDPHALQIQEEGTNAVARVLESSKAVAHMSTAMPCFPQLSTQTYLEPSQRTSIPTLTSLLNLPKKRLKKPVIKRKNVEPFSNQYRLVASSSAASLSAALSYA
ncbi:hypothetical protein DXG03_003360 [Asterophora parasitica]|uniref:Uncharacterized protein n=1 Tax=Asterophora parasitica TaxID=117018 RepID=A0A9P7K8C8_9AGAR|nr:hypothetical protein DXG03_003360 [Asterophora parasitica]